MIQNVCEKVMAMENNETNTSLERDLLAWIWFSCLPSSRSFRKSTLLDHFGHPRFLMDADGTSLAGMGLEKGSLRSHLLNEAFREQAAKILEQARHHGMQVFTRDSMDYPPALAHLPDGPLVLYCSGNWRKERCIAVVGSRRATAYGLGMAERLSSGLADAGFTVVSGLARGIDTAAHLGALGAGGQTIAVLGSGIDVVYPPENARLAERLCHSGWLLSEYAPGTPASAHHFPVRNRIVSGLAEAVLVVEAGERSGSLITVQCALEQGRDVFAVPGNATSVCSRGSNRLIREGAGLVQEVADLLEALPLYGGENIGKSLTIRSLPPLEIPEQIVFGRISREAVTPDVLCAQSGLSPAEVQQVLLMLEIKGYIQQDSAGLIWPLAVIQ